MLTIDRRITHIVCFQNIKKSCYSTINISHWEMGWLIAMPLSCCRSFKICRKILRERLNTSTCTVGIIRMGFKIISCAFSCGVCICNDIHFTVYRVIKMIHSKQMSVLNATLCIVCSEIEYVWQLNGCNNSTIGNDYIILMSQKVETAFCNTWLLLHYTLTYTVYYIPC